MISGSLINSINKVIASYFENHKDETKVRAKTLMPEFIEAQIFTHDHRGGLPIRQVLRTLDKSNNLPLIPSVLPERKKKNTNWFFIRLKQATLK
jgi:uncharacterized protein YpmS